MLDKIQVQKAATPEPGRTAVEDATRQLEQLKPNGVVLVQSSYDEAECAASRDAAQQCGRQLSIAFCYEKTEEPYALCWKAHVHNVRRQEMQLTNHMRSVGMKRICHHDGNIEVCCAHDATNVVLVFFCCVDIIIISRVRC